MTIQTTVNKIFYTGDNATVAFTYNFRVDRAEDMSVYLDGVLTESGWSIIGLGEATGGTVTFDTAPGTGVEIVLAREIALEQLVDYKPYDPFPAETHEFTLDKLTMIDQQIAENLTRAITIPISYDNVDMVITPVADGILKWNADATALETTELYDVVDRISYNGDARLTAVPDGVIAGVDPFQLQSISGKIALAFTDGGSSLMYFNNDPKLETALYGITIHGATDQDAMLYVISGMHLVSLAESELVYIQATNASSQQRDILIGDSEGSVKLTFEGAIAVETIEYGIKPLVLIEVPGAIYIGDQVTQGSWQISRNGDDLEFERYNGVLWETKQIIYATGNPYGPTELYYEDNMRVQAALHGFNVVINDVAMFAIQAVGGYTSLINFIEDDILTLQGTKTGGATGQILQGDPNAETYLCYEGSKVVETIPFGFKAIAQFQTPGAYYCSPDDSDAEGSWKMVRSGDDLIFQRREGAAWVTKHTMSA